MMMIKPFQQAVPILEQIEKAGYEAYFVGGSVRDYLLNKEIDDVDIASSATPIEIKTIFSKTVDVGIEHGTVLVLYKGNTYEITTFRSESGYEDFRRPQSVTFIRSLYEDLKRRDFTMNAIAMDRKGKLIDPFRGTEAIHNKIIQTVGKAEERFNEDALRMMRALRFVSQLSFKMDQETFLALEKYGRLLENISVERKTKEFEKLLLGINCQGAIQLLIDSNLYQFLPGLSGREEALQQFSTYHVHHLTINEIWSFLLHNLGVSSVQSSSFLKKWRLSNQKLKEVEKILYYLEYRTNENWDRLSLYQAGLDISLSVERIVQVLHVSPNDEDLKAIHQEYITLPIKSKADLAVTGQDLILWLDKAGGPWLSKLIAELEHAILLGKIPNQKEVIREWLNHCSQK
jgi:tRNA nucleotidyltransferase (CCA-adding enzyme)